MLNLEFAFSFYLTADRRVPFVSLCEPIVIFPALCLLVFAFCFSFLADSSSQTEDQCRYARNAFREDSQSRACGSVQRRGPMFLRGWQGSRSGATREAIRAMHMDGPARSVPSRKYVTIHPPIHPVWLRCLRTPTLPRSPRSGALPAGRLVGRI